MEENFIKVTLENIEKEHLCCAISDKKHQTGVEEKKKWLKERIKEGHVFYKLDAKAKVFIEYAPLEKAWVPVIGDNYMYIYCLWVAGSYKGKGFGKALLYNVILDSKQKGKDGVCILTSKKKKPFLSDKKFLQKYGFEVVDTWEDYELLALSFKKENVPQFSDSVKKGEIPKKGITIYYTKQCPYIANCLKEIQNYANQEKIQVKYAEIDTVEKAKNLPIILNNWAVCKDGKLETTTLLNENTFKKIIENE